MLPNNPAHGTSSLHPDYHSHTHHFTYLVQPNDVDGIFFNKYFY